MPEPSEDARRIARLFALTVPPSLTACAGLAPEPWHAATQLRGLALQVSICRETARNRDSATVPVPATLASTIVRALNDAAKSIHPDS